MAILSSVVNSEVVLRFCNRDPSVQHKQYSQKPFSDTYESPWKGGDGVSESACAG